MIKPKITFLRCHRTPREETYTPEVECKPAKQEERKKLWCFIGLCSRSSLQLRWKGGETPYMSRGWWGVRPLCGEAVMDVETIQRASQGERRDPHAQKGRGGGEPVHLTRLFLKEGRERGSSVRSRETPSRASRSKPQTLTAPSTTCPSTTTRFFSKVRKN